MATNKEKLALLILLDEIETLRCWLDDTAYPRRSRSAFEEAVEDVRVVFAMSDEKFIYYVWRDGDEPENAERVKALDSQEAACIGLEWLLESEIKEGVFKVWVSNSANLDTHAWNVEVTYSPQFYASPGFDIA
jgi:hypothetical protein